MFSETLIIILEKEKRKILNYLNYFNSKKNKRILSKNNFILFEFCNILYVNLFETFTYVCN